LPLNVGLNESMKNEEDHLQRNEAKWDKWAKSFDDESTINNYLRNAQEKLVSLLDIKENVHFLDVGCGTGWAVGLVAKRVDDKGLFYGIDLSSNMIEKATKNFQGKENFHFIQANAGDIPLETDFFDIIICTNSFHHYPNPEKALREMARLLKNGGRLYILDMSADNWFVRVVINRIIKKLQPEYVCLYSSKQFQRLFEQTGLRYLSSRKITLTQRAHIGEK